MSLLVRVWDIHKKRAVDVWNKKSREFILCFYLRACIGVAYSFAAHRARCRRRRKRSTALSWLATWGGWVGGQASSHTRTCRPPLRGRVLLLCVTPAAGVCQHPQQQQVLCAAAAVCANVVSEAGGVVHHAKA